MIAEGKYKARPIAWGLSESKNGHEQFAIGFEIIDGQPGDTITWYGGFSNDQATDITIKGIKACGWTGSDLSNVDLPGTEVQLVIIHEEYPAGSGKVNPRVKFINGPGQGIKQMDPNKQKAFALKMQQRIKAFDAKNGAPAARSAPAPYGTSGHGANAKHTAPQDDDSDIPFISQADTVRAWLS